MELVRKYTWKRMEPDPILVRLDYILVSKCITNQIPNSDIIPGHRSDHDLVQIILKSHEGKRGPGVWKLNTLLLKDSDYCNQTQDLISELTKKSFKTPAHKWNYIQFKVKEFSINFAKNQKRSRVNKLKTLERKIESTTHDLVMGSELFSSRELCKHLENLTKEKENLICISQQGAALRARRKWLEYGEKNTKLFFSLEKKNYSNKTMYQIKGQKDEIITDNKKILQEQHNFFKSLYSTRHMVISEDYLTDIDFPQLTHDQKELLAQDITLSEIKSALFDMKFDKVTGSQGLPPEWYVKFWDEISGLLFHVITDASKLGFDKSSSRGIITLMEKPGRDKMRISQWRPLTMLNTDFKILSKLLARRMKKVLPSIIHHDQAGFMVNRGTTDNLMKLITTMEYCEKQNIDALLVSFDSHKAFDTVEYKVLFRIMKSFGFPEKFINMIRALYTGMESCTINKGYSSPYIKITQGLRQGCPISSVCYLVLVEVLGLKIRQNQNIQGITVGEHTNKLGQFADDLWASIIASQTNYTELINTVDKFCIETGQKINYNKTQVIRIGSLRKSNARFYSDKQLHWLDKVKVLGIDICADRQQMMKINYDNLILKVQTTLNKWHARSLTLAGRVLVVNTLAASLAMQKFTCLPTPDDTIFKKFKDLVINFIWKAKRPKIAYNTLIQDTVKGSLKLVDFKSKEQSLKVTWIKKYSDKPESYNRAVVTAILSAPIESIWRSNISTKHITNNIKIHNTVWESIWCAWSRVSYHTPKTKDEVLFQPIYFNSNTLRENKPFIDPTRRDGNNLRWYDIYDENKQEYYTHQQIAEKYNILFLDYYAIISAIPSNWKILVTNNTQDKNTKAMLSQDLFEGHHKISKRVYLHIVNNIPVIDAARIKWNEILKMENLTQAMGKNKVKN